MAYATTPALVAAVINAGGLGFLGAGNEPSHKLADAIDEARAAVTPDKQHLVGMGFVGWVLDKFNTEADPRLTTVLNKAPVAVWFAFGKDLGKYVSQVRAHDATRDHKTLVFVNVNTVEEAQRAANEWKVDVIVVQGAEAGGRGSTYSPPTQEFLKAVLDVVPNGPLVIAAGGISTGTQVAEKLIAGASAVVLGTRLLFTPECMFSDEIKKVLIESGPDSTARSPAYDLAFPPGVWPDGIEARCVNNGVVADFEADLSPADRKANIASGKSDYLIVYAGTGVGDVSEIKSTADVIHGIHEEAVAALKSSGSQLLG